MTLATTVRIAAPLNPWQVFEFCRGLIGADDSHLWDHVASVSYSGAMTYRNHPGQGLPSLLRVAHAVDGPLPPYPDEGCMSPACVEVVFDTGYSYEGPEGSCSDLSRSLTAKLGAWLDERGADWIAQDEFTGEWHHRTPCPVTS